MNRVVDIQKRAGASRHSRVRPLWVLAVAMLVIAAALTSPAVSIANKAAIASYEKDVEALPGDASPKEACAVLIEHHKAKPAQELQCRKLIADGFEAAKTVSNDSGLTIHAATMCVEQVLAQKKSPDVTKQCSKQLVEEEEARRDREGDDGGGSLFDAAAGFVGGAVDGVTGAVGGAIEGSILDGFNAIIDFLFGGLQAMITVALIKWIITIPNLSDGHVGDLESRIALGAGALLAATMTVSIVRFWASGLTGGGAWAGAEGVARTAVAACLIGLWPRIFDLAVKASNAMQSGILNEGAEHQLKSLFQNIGKVGFFTAGQVPVFLSIVTAIVGMLMLLALVAMKIIITSLTIVLFCATPLALVLWPIPELSGATKFCLRSLGVVLAIPVIWCVLFGAFAAIGADTFTFHNTGKDQGIFGTTLNVAIVKPLVSISLLYLALVMPRRLLQMAPFMGGGGGGIVRTVATGAALRAGFSYAPQGASAAAAGWRGNPSERLQVHGSSFEKRAMEAGRSLRGVDSKGATKAAPPAPKLPGGQEGATPAKGAQQNQAPPTRDKNGNLQPPGPWTSQQTIPHKEDVEARKREMDFSQKSGQRGAVQQAEQAIRTLDGIEDRKFYDAGMLAGRYWSNDQATKAFADWSKNPAVPSEARDAFWTLGGTSPTERKMAFESYLDSQILGGGTAEGGDQTSSGPSPSGSSSPRSASERASGAPTPPSSASERGRPSPTNPNPSPSRTPHAQPPQGGDSGS